MKIAIIGSGGVGGYFGGRLAAAGHEVTFIARGAHFKAMRENGLKVLSALGDLHIKDVSCSDDTMMWAPPYPPRVNQTAGCWPKLHKQMK